MLVPHRLLSLLLSLFSNFPVVIGSRLGLITNLSQAINGFLFTTFGLSIKTIHFLLLIVIVKINKHTIYVYFANFIR